MELPVGEVQQRFGEAMRAAESGETVTFTRDGLPVLELTAVGRDRRVRLPTAEECAQNKAAMGFEPDEEVWPAEFDDPAFSRAVLGLE